MCRIGAGSDPDPVEREEAAVDEDPVDLLHRERRHRSRFEPGRLDDQLRAGDARLRTPARGCNLGRVGAAIARNEHEQDALIASKDERLDDLPKLTADRLRRVPGGRRPLGELLDAGLCSRFPQKRCHPLDRLGPRHQ